MNVRKLAIEAIEKIINKGGFTHIVVDEYLNKFVLSEADKGLFTKIVYGTVENLLTLEYYLEPFIPKKRQKPWVKFLLLSAVYQIVYLKIPEYAVINESVEIANLTDRAVGGFINGVLRNFLRTSMREFAGLDEIQTLSIKYSYPAWLVAYLLKDYSFEDVEKIFIENQKVRKTAVRVNTLLSSFEEVVEQLDKLGIEYEHQNLVKDGLFIAGNVSKLNLFTSGKITIQDLSAQRVAEVISPKQTDKVLDLCSAPGGKTAHLATIMKNKGEIIACDIFPHKIKLMEKSFERMKLNNIELKLLDARKASEVYNHESFDHVLADVPCSGLGVMGHKVDLKYQINLESIEEIKILQEEILESTFSLVKVGGHYTYSTCTLNKEENEEQILKFIKGRDDVEIVYEETIFPYSYSSDGFYICKMRKIK